MPSLKLIRLTAQDNLATWAEKTNSIINVLENFITTSGSIISNNPANSHLVVWDQTNTQFTNKELIGPIVIDTSYSNTTSFKFKPTNQLITDLTENTTATGNDYVLIYDVTNTQLRKVKISSIQTSQVAAGSDTQIQFNQNGYFGASSNLTYNYSSNVLNLNGGLAVGTNKLFVQTTGNNVGVGTNTPAYRLDVSGDVNVQSASTYRIGGQTVLSYTSLGSTVVSSSLTSVGTLSTLTVSGNTNLQGPTVVSNTFQANSITSVNDVNATNLIASSNVSAATITVSSSASNAIHLTSSTSGTGIRIGSNPSGNNTILAADFLNGFSLPTNTAPTHKFSLSFYRNITTGVDVNNYLGSIDFYGKNSSGAYVAGAGILSVAAAAFTSTSSPASLQFLTTSVNSTTPVERMRIFPSGRVVIGPSISSSDDARGTLYVKGTDGAAIGDTLILNTELQLSRFGSGDRSNHIKFYTYGTNTVSAEIRKEPGSNGNFAIIASSGHLFISQENTSYTIALVFDGKNYIKTLLGRVSIGEDGYYPIDLYVRGMVFTNNNIQLGKSFNDGTVSSKIDLFGESSSSRTYTDYSTRLVRNTGTNGNFQIINRGTGGIIINNYESGSISLYTANTQRVVVGSNGTTTVYGTLEVV